MKPLREFSPKLARRADFVLCDLDDTLTCEGRLPAASYAGLERLQRRGKKVIVVTGRPAGWCDLIARFWPVDGVVGENGAFYFRYRRDLSRMVRRFLRTDAQRAKDRAKLQGLFKRVRKDHPKIRLASDQAFRISDIAIDICEDVTPLSKAEVKEIVAELQALGATVKVSSIHINAWMGEFNKLSMIEKFLKREFAATPAAAKKRAIYVGDSPNDEPMFAFFPNAVGVANVAKFAADMKALPRYVTRRAGGYGFVELANMLSHDPAPLNRRDGRSRGSFSPARR